MAENVHIPIYATLILRGRGLNPQNVTDSLGLSPSMSFARGDIRNKQQRWKHNFWSYSSNDRIHSDNLADHLEWLIMQLEPVKSKLLGILSGENVESEINCLWIMPTSHEYLSLSIELVKKIAELGILVTIETYTPGTDVE